MRSRRTRSFETLEQRSMLAIISIPSFGTDAGDSRDAQIIGHLESGDPTDRYTLNMDAGDILDVDLNFIDQTPSSGLQGAAALSLVDNSGTQLIGPDTFGPGMVDIDAVAPIGSPIREVVEHHSSLAFVIPSTGTYHVDVGLGTMDFGGYEIDMQVYRPVLESMPVGTVQRIWLDFDGTTFNPFQEIGDGRNATVTTADLAAFLDDWNLNQNDLQAVEDAIEATVIENLKTDLESQFASTGVEILTSDDGDFWGDTAVTRVIVGGTNAETGIGGTVGKAESVSDIGNFDLEQTAIVHLNQLSGPATDTFSINHFNPNGGAAKIALVGRTVGNIVSHELGHLLGVNHTDNSNASSVLMDSGGSTLEPITLDIDFGVDDFFIGPAPGISAAGGQQDGAAIIALGMPRGLNKAEPFVHSVVVFDGTDSRDVLYVTGTGPVGSIQLSGDISRSYSNVVLFQFHGQGGDDHFDAEYSNIPINAFGGNGNDTLKGGAFNDRLVGDAGIDTIFGNGWHDILEGGSGQDYLDGGAGDDDIYGSLASNPSADGAQDWLIGGSGFDEAWGETSDLRFSIEAFFLA